MYQRQATGIAPEIVEIPGGPDIEAAAREPFYILRPEAAESLFILHQLTGNPVYREWGWKMFEAIERGCKTAFGYGAHPDVRDPGRTPDDRMESFFLAETLKYLYLLQSPDHSISLARYTFNTEAHPLSIFTSDRWGESGGGRPTTT
jgi:mannosyl-oligosaccharide alpha-1,2-mannosidase